MLDSTQKQSDFINPEECQALATAMQTKYRMALKDRSFHIQAEIKGRGVFVSVVLQNPEKTFYYPIEGRVMFEKEELKSSEAALFLIDYIDTYLEEFLMEEDEEIYLPIDWADHQYEGINFQIRGQIHNLKLEEMADQWLKGEEKV